MGLAVFVSFTYRRASPGTTPFEVVAQPR